MPAPRARPARRSGRSRRARAAASRFRGRSRPARARGPGGPARRRRPASRGSCLPRGGRRARCSGRSRSGRAELRRRRAARRGSRCPRLESCPMTQIVVPYRGENGKQRLDTSDDARAQLALAMLGDVLAAATVAGRTLVVTDDKAGRALAAELGAEPVADAPGGPGSRGRGRARAARQGHRARRQCRRALRRPARSAHARWRGGARRDRLRRGRGRDDERAGAAGEGALRAALRRRQRRPLPRPRRQPRRAGDLLRDPEPERRRRHARRSATGSACGPARGRRPRSAARCSA